HDCIHCGAAFTSRNLLFKHLMEKCDPSAAKDREGKQRLIFVIGYLGSRYRCMALQHERDEAVLPSVEGALTAAVKRAWGDVVLGVVRCTRTERGVHAAENVVVFTVRATDRCQAALVRELDGLEIWLLATPRPPPKNVNVFDKVFSSKKRAYNYFVPFFALLTADERALWCAGEAAVDLEKPGGLWLGPVFEGCSIAQVVRLLADHGISADEKDVMVTNGSGHAQILMPAESVALAQQRLEGFVWHDIPLVAMALHEALAKFSVQRRTRAVLKALKGGDSKKLRSFHNFMQPQPAAKDQVAMRQLLHCSALGLTQSLRRPGGKGWAFDDWTAITFASADFGPQQLRRMAGALVAVVRGSEPLSYIDRCFQEAPLQAPAAPAEVICLEAVEIGGYDSDWRRLAEVDSSAGVEVRRRVRERVVDSAKAWEDFVHGLESGRSRAQLRVELTQAAEAGDLPRLAAAIEAGAPLDAGNEYGQTAAFLAALGGQTEVLRTLAAARADLGRAANGGVTPCRAAMAKGFKGALEVIAQEAAGVSGAQAEALACLAGWSASSSSSPSGASSARVTTVIPAE
ncbi:unnamed protein product, partial [Polarella glacialis]